MNTKALYSLLLAILVTVLSVQAMALDPEESTFISNTAIEIPEAVSDNEGADPRTRFLGIRGCRQNLNRSTKISVTFTAGSGVTFTENVDGRQRLENVFLYDVESPGDTVTCPSSACTELKDEPNSEDLRIGDTSVRVFLDFDEFVGLTDASECEGFKREYFVRLVLRGSQGDSSVLHEARLVLDTERPPAVTLTDVTATESNVELTWSLPDDVSDIKTYTLYYSSEPFSGGTTADDIAGLTTGASRGSNDGGRTRMNSEVSLMPGQTVYVSVAARDQTTNESILPEPLNTTAIETQDFWEYYREQGGSETGGCSTTETRPPLAGLVLVLLGLGVLRFRKSQALRRGLVGASAAVVFCLPAVDAQASESPTYGFFEFRLGTYYPAIDDEFGGDTAPFRDVFGDGNLFYGEFELGFFIYQGLGKAGVSGHFGYTTVSGNAISEAEVGDETSFTVFPIRASLFYRFDKLATDMGIPLVPVGKLGLDWVFWSVAATDGDTATFEGDSASGGIWGYHGALGIHFLLDIIDPSSAALFDLNWGINNSYLFAEFMMTQINNFGGDGFDLSDNIWLFGLSFEF